MTPAVSIASPAALTAAALARELGAELRGRGELVLTGLNTLAAAGPSELSFVRSPQYAAQWHASRAGACLWSRAVPAPETGLSDRALLVVPDADLALIKAIPLFAPPRARPTPGIHPTAIVDPAARIAGSATVGPLCIIGPECEIADACVIHARVTLGRGVRIGPRTQLESGVAIHDLCVLGADCLIHSNAVIGADGFGFRASPDGRGVIKIPHAGNVVIHDHVELGACSCIDRGKFGPTVIGAGTKIDNLVQIAHNVQIGRGCLIAACTGIGGSVTMGDGVQVGGHAGIADNTTIAAGARVGAFAAVFRDIEPGQAVLGVPAVPAKQFFRHLAILQRLADPTRRGGGGE